MEHKEGESPEIAEINTLNADCFTDLKQESKRLTADLALMNDAIDSHAVQRWMTVRSVINDLTDKIEIDRLTREVAPKSKFHKNPGAVARLVQCLIHWKNKDLFSNQDSMARVSDSLSKRLAENAQFL